MADVWRDTTVIAIEGNIGVGKSTFLERLRAEFADDARVVFVAEPVAEWESVRDEKGRGVLECYYRDKNRYAFSFQMLAYISRLSALRAALAARPAVVVMERSLETDRRVFAAMLHDDGHIGQLEMSIYLKWYDAFMADLPPTKHVYLRCDPATAAARAKRRARAGECVPLAYLRACHDYHERWLMSGDARCVVRLAADADTREDPRALDGALATARAMIRDARQRRVATIALHFDGASRGNPGHAATGYVVHERPGDAVLVRGGRYIGANVTNNCAEYTALIDALESLAALGVRADRLEVRGDSQLVLNQVEGTWDTKSAALRPLRDRVRQLLSAYDGEARLEHVPRDQNTHADFEANRALDRALRRRVRASG